VDSDATLSAISGRRRRPGWRPPAPHALGLACTLLIAAGAAAPAAAQLSAEARIGGSLDSIGSSGTDADRRSAAAGSLFLGYDLDEERARLFYSFGATTYATPGDWSTLSHELGATYRFDLSDSGNRLFLGASGTWRDNGEDWAAAGYRGLMGRANLELRPGAGATLRLGYRFDVRDFPDLPELNQTEHDGFVSALVNFQTRTTLIGELHLGTKSYDGSPSGVAIDSDSALPSNGRGRGGMGPHLRLAATVAPSVSEMRADRVAWLVRVAQSLADRAGLSLQYDARHTSGDVPPALVTTPALFFDDGVYDDPYASDARGVRAVLKWVTGSYGTARAWGSWERKDYVTTPALAASGDPTGELRADRLWRAGGDWELPLFPARTGDAALDLGVFYGFTRHRSNDAFYDYSSHVVGASLSVAY
jgi:hypothetical protein